MSLEEAVDDPDSPDFRPCIGAAVSEITTCARAVSAAAHISEHERAIDQSQRCCAMCHPKNLQTGSFVEVVCRILYETAARRKGARARTCCTQDLSHGTPIARAASNPAAVSTDLKQDTCIGL